MVNQMILEKHEAMEIPSTSKISAITFSGQMRDEQTHLLPVSYTHLTLPTIYSV